MKQEHPNQCFSVNQLLWHSWEVRQAQFCLQVSPAKASTSLPQAALFLLEEDGVFSQCKSQCGSELLLMMTARPTWYWFCALSALGTLGLCWGPSSWQGSVG